MVAFASQSVMVTNLIGIVEVLLMEEIRRTTWDLWNPVSNGMTTNLKTGDRRISSINSITVPQFVFVFQVLVRVVVRVFYCRWRIFACWQTWGATIK